MKKVFIFCLVFVFAVCGYLFADTVTLTTGQEIEGDILNQTADSVSIDFMGIELTYFMDEVAAINGSPVGGPAAPESITVAPQRPPEPDPALTSTFDSGDIIERGEALSRSLQPEPPVSTQPDSAEPPPFMTRDTITESDYDIPPEAATGAVVAMGAVMVLMFIFGIVAYVYGALCLQFIAKKTNQGPVWMAWVPVANLFLMARIAGIPYTWLFIFLAGFIPYIGALVTMGFAGYIWWKISEARGKPGWIGILCVLPLISFAGMGILAFTE